MKISKELSTGTLPMLVLSVLGSEDLYGYRIIRLLTSTSRLSQQTRQVLSTLTLLLQEQSLTNSHQTS